MARFAKLAPLMAAQQDEDFAAMFEATPKAPGARGARRVKPGQLVEGTVVEFGAESVFVDIGAKSEARIECQQLLDKDGKLKVAIGDKLRATVAQANHEVEATARFTRQNPQLLRVALGPGSPDLLAMAHNAQWILV